MDFALSPLALALRDRLLAFMDRYLLPYNAAWHAAVAAGDYPPPFVEDLKALALFSQCPHGLRTFSSGPSMA